MVLLVIDVNIMHNILLYIIPFLSLYKIFTVSCPSNCNGNGKCLSIGQMASYTDNVNYFTSYSYELWDEDKIIGCVCDDGWWGYDCSRSSCLSNDDPVLTVKIINIIYYN